MEALTMIISGVIGTLAFAVLFYVSPRNLFFGGLAGFLAITVYLLTESLGIFLANAIASVVITAYCEIIARVRKSPVITFLTPAVIVLVPGSSLYYTVYNLIAENNSLAYHYGMKTVDTCLGIVAGVLGTSLIVNIIIKFIEKKKAS